MEEKEEAETIVDKHSQRTIVEEQAIILEDNVELEQIRSVVVEVISTSTMIWEINSMMTNNRLSTMKEEAGTIVINRCNNMEMTMRSIIHNRKGRQEEIKTNEAASQAKEETEVVIILEEIKTQEDVWVTSK